MVSRRMDFRIAGLLTGLVAAVAGEGVARAVPSTMTQQGLLLDENNVPVSGSLTFVFSIYAAATGGTAVWTETQMITLDGGYFSTQLGSVTPIGPTVFGGGTMYLGIQVGNDAEMVPREAMTSVPYALVSLDATGNIHPNSVTVNGLEVINDAGAWVGPTTGLAGSAGATGAQGPAGATGAQGAAGPQGIAGAQGPQGAAGPTGAQGLQGIQGPAGANGTNGAPGATGSTGAQGLQGIQGPSGTNGTNGTNGAQGATGPTGAQGLQGIQGPSGTNGTNGTNGAPGATGPTGLQGLQGIQGADGAGGNQRHERGAGSHGSHGPGGSERHRGDGALGGRGGSVSRGAVSVPAGCAGERGDHAEPRLRKPQQHSRHRWSVRVFDGPHSARCVRGRHRRLDTALPLPQDCDGRVDVLRRRAGRERRHLLHDPVWDRRGFPRLGGRLDAGHGDVQLRCLRDPDGRPSPSGNWTSAMPGGSPATTGVSKVAVMVVTP